MTQKITGILIAVAFSLAAGLGFAQAPRTISHQGLLTDTSGDPVVDASRSMTFKIYNASAGGAQLWSETKDVSTVNGVFSTELGSVTPLSGVDFDQELWLSVKVGADPEMAQRTKLTSVPNAIGLVMPYRDSLRIETLDLGTDGSEIFGDDISVHAGDAFLGLYSNNIGVAGSGLYLAEIAAGAMTNKWSIYRATTGAQSSLNFTFGSDPQYALNPRVLEIGPTGNVNASGDFITSENYRYSSPRTYSYHLAAAAFKLAENEENSNAYGTRWRELNGYIECPGCFPGGKFTTRVQLPDSAEVQNFTVYYFDNNVVHDMELDFRVKRRGILSSGTQSMGSSPAVSSGTSIAVQSKTINTEANAFRIIDNSNYMYWAEVDFNIITGDGSNQRFYGMTIEYEIDRAGR